MVIKKNIDEFRSFYQSNYGNVDSVSHTFGWASHEKFYSEMAAWQTFIGSVIPNWFPLNYIRDGLNWIVDQIYNSEAQNRYNKGVDQGRAIVGKVQETIDWAKGEISNQVNTMKNTIDSQIVAPVRDKANAISAQLDQAKQKLDSMTSTLNGHTSSISDLQARIQALENKKQSPIFSMDSLKKLTGS